MLKSVVLSLAVVHVSADENGLWTGVSGLVNWGVNAGGCYACEAYQDDAAALYDFCRELCVSDPDCKSFEVAAGAAAYELYVENLGGIQCCIEHVDPSEPSFPNAWVLASKLEGNCGLEGNHGSFYNDNVAAEMSLWTTYIPDDRARCAPDHGARAASALDDEYVLVDCCQDPPPPSDPSDASYWEAAMSSTYAWIYLQQCWDPEGEDEDEDEDEGDDSDAYRDAWFLDQGCQGECPPASARSYYVGDGATSYDDAVEYCEARGATIAVIHSEADNAAAYAACTVGGVSRNCWLGLEFGWDGVDPEEISEQFGTWHWQTGEPLVWTWWEVDEGTGRWFGEDRTFYGTAWQEAWHDYGGGGFETFPLCVENAPDACSGLAKKTCKQTAGCAYKKKTCISCSELSKKKCKKTDGCIYKKKQCSAASSCSGLSKKKCKTTDGCKYKKKKDKCLAK